MAWVPLRKYLSLAGALKSCILPLLLAILLFCHKGLASTAGLLPSSIAGGLRYLLILACPLLWVGSCPLPYQQELHSSDPPPSPL